MVADVRASAGPQTAARLDDVLIRLGEPLRLAVAGRLKAGKSTVVNALLRQRVAPTAAGECTRVVTWFRYGHEERVEIERRDGRVHRLGLDLDRRLPEDLGATAEDIHRVTVHLSNDMLRDLTIIDTPGLDTLTAGLGEATESLLGIGGPSLDAVGQADGLLFLVPQLMEQDVARLQRFAAGRSSAGHYAGNALGVLSRADQLDGPDGPWPTAGRLAGRYAGQLQNLVADVLPLMGLLAETADAGVLTEEHGRALRRLATLPACEQDDLLLAGDLFVSLDAPVEESARRALLAVLGIHGVTIALGAVNRGAAAAGAIADELRRASGVDALRQRIDSVFAGRADLIKAGHAVEELERLSVHEPDRAVARRLRLACEAVRDDPAFHHLRELQIHHAVCSGALELADDDLRAAIDALALGSTPAERLGLPAGATAGELAAAARRRAKAWRIVENDGRTPLPLRRAAEALGRSYVLLWEAAAEG